MRLVNIITAKEEYDRLIVGNEHGYALERISLWYGPEYAAEIERWHQAQIRRFFC